MRYAVTGAYGYIGSHVTECLRAMGHEVMAVGRPTEGGPDVLASGPSIFEQLGRPDVCIHLAWQDGFIHNSDSHLDNVQAHYRFMRNMLAGGLKHLVGIGSMHEIGYHVGAIDETTPTNPVTAYGIAKDYLRKTQSHLCKEYGAVNQWLRCYYLTGDDKRNHSIFTKILLAVEAGEKTFPLNSGEYLFDFQRVQDVARQIALVSSQNEVVGTINCCSGSPVSLRSKVLAFIAEKELDMEPQWGAFPSRPYDSVAVWGNTTKLRNALHVAGEVVDD